MNEQAKPRNGPEWMPIRQYVKEYKIVVEFYDSDDKLVREEVLDYGKSEDRIWLGRLSYWGWTNGYTIETSEYKVKE